MANRNISLRWISHLDSLAGQEDFKTQVLNSTKVLSRLTDILDEEIKSLEKAESSLGDFDNTAWAYKQAFRNGQLASLLKLKQLLPDRG